MKNKATPGGALGRPQQGPLNLLGALWLSPAEPAVRHGVTESWMLLGQGTRQLAFPSSTQQAT